MAELKQARIVKVFIGRFQPFHDGHLRVLKAACATSDLVVVMVGSAQESGTIKNPWSAAARMSMIHASLTPAEQKVVKILSYRDVPGDDSTWVRSVKEAVRITASANIAGRISYTLVGCHKGADTYYLRLYKGWKLELVPQAEALNATDIRERYFQGSSDWKENLPPASVSHLEAFQLYRPEDYLSLRQQWEIVRHDGAMADLQKINK